MKIPWVLKQQLTHNAPVPCKTGVDWYLFAWFADYYSNTNMLEIGVGDGGSAITMASYAKKLTVIDTWNQGWLKSNFDHLVTTLNLSVEFVEQDSTTISATDLSTYSFVHLDANKGYENTIKDLDLVSQICIGVICVDDYLQSMWPEVTWAVDDWIKQNNWKIVFIGNHQVFISKQGLRIPELVVEWPVVDRGRGFHLTYGKYPTNETINKFIKAGDMLYTWHKNADITLRKQA